MPTPATAKKTPPTSSTPSVRKAPATAKRQKDACNLLDADHKAVKALFKEYEALTESRSRSTAKKRRLADQICKKLTVHATTEEEIFYPAARKATKNNALLNEATVEHASAKDLIVQIGSMDAGDEMFDAKVTVPGEYIDHYVKEERSEMFVKVCSTKLDLVKLSGQLQARKEELMAGQAQPAATPVSELSTAL